MNLKMIVAVLALAAVPLSAQAQKPAMKVTKADAQKVVTIISTDKAKAQVYCDLVKLGDQIGEADTAKDEKKVEELSKKMDELSDKLGPEYTALMDGMQDVDPSSKEAEEIGQTLEGLDKLCAK